MIYNLPINIQKTSLSKVAFPTFLRFVLCAACRVCFGPARTALHDSHLVPTTLLFRVLRQGIPSFLAGSVIHF